MPCHNYNHLPGEHNGADALIEMLEDTRRWLGDRLLVIHAGGQACWLPCHNIADQIVTLEEARRNIGDGGIGQYPFSIEFMGSASSAIVPNTFEDETLRGGPNLKRGIANLVHLNAIPYIYSYAHTGSKNFGYRNWGQFIADEDAIFGLFRKFARIDFTRYRFAGPRSGTVRIKGRRRDVLASAYLGQGPSAGDSFVIVSNQTRKPAPGGEVLLAIQGGALTVRFPKLRPYEVKILQK